MKFNPDIHHRHSIRLKDYDYSEAGYYFVTICTYKKECLFGEILNNGRGKNFFALTNDFAPTDAGKIAEQCWREIPKHYPNVLLDEFVIMPNHVHGIIVIDNAGTANNARAANNVGANNYSPLRNGTSKTIGAIIRGFKIGVTKWMRNNSNVYGVWQRNYYEHIIRDENDLKCIREYIVNNPLKWELDEYYK